MALYEYTCSRCAHRFEKLVRGGVVAGEIECPSCGSTETTRLVSAFSTRLASADSSCAAGGCAAAPGGG